MANTSYASDFKLGALAVKGFTDTMDALGIPWTNANMAEQHNGIDIKTKKYCYEVKYQKYEKSIVVEEKDGLREGWIYSTKADYIVYVHLNGTIQTTMLKVQELRDIYNKIKKNYKLQFNKKTDGERGDVWQGSFRIIPINDLIGYLSVYKLGGKK